MKVFVKAIGAARRSQGPQRKLNKQKGSKLFHSELLLDGRVHWTRWTFLLLLLPVDGEYCTAVPLLIQSQTNFPFLMVSTTSCPSAGQHRCSHTSSPWASWLPLVSHMSCNYVWSRSKHPGAQGTPRVLHVVLRVWSRSMAFGKASFLLPAAALQNNSVLISRSLIETQRHFSSFFPWRGPPHIYSHHVVLQWGMWWTSMSLAASSSCSPDWPHPDCFLERPPSHPLKQPAPCHLIFLEGVLLTSSSVVQLHDHLPNRALHGGALWWRLAANLCLTSLASQIETTS